jgi:phage tail-like protein
MAGWGSDPWGGGPFGGGGPSEEHALTPFTRELGATQGRIQPANWLPREGSWVVCLGSDRPGMFVRLADGDRIRATQIGDVDGHKILRPKLHVRPPSTTPTGATWTARMLVDGIAVAEVPFTDARDFDDIAANVSALTSDVELSFELLLTGSGGPWELELPALYVDALTIDSPAARPMLANRFPAPNTTQIARDTTIQLDLMDTTASGIDPDSITVYVDGEVAFADGDWTAAFDGPDQEFTSLDGGRTRRLRIDPTTDFASLEFVDVRVVAATNDGEQLDQIYSFRIEDFTVPTVVSARATSGTATEVEFDEPVLQASAAGVNDALNPDNWEITLVSSTGDSSIYRSAVWVAITAVTSVSDRKVALTVDMEMSPRAVYRVTALGVRDLFGNQVEAPNNTATFTAVGEQPPDRQFHVTELLPPVAIQEDETGDYLRWMGVVQDIFELLLRHVDRWPDIIDPELAPEPFVDAMLQDLGNPFTFELTLLEKRKLALLLVPIYKSKGTARGIKGAIRTLMGLEVTLSYPYFSGGRLGVAKLDESFILAGSQRHAYSYRIHSPRALTDVERSRITEIAKYMQVAHEHLIGIVEPGGPPAEPDHMVLGLSRLGINWRLH